MVQVGLDKRTCCRGIILNSVQWKDTVLALKVFYIEFNVKSKVYIQKKLKERTSAIADVNDENLESENDNGAVVQDIVQEFCCDNDDMVIFDGVDMMETDNAAVANLKEDDLVELGKKVAGEEYDKVIKSWITIKLP